MSEKIKRITLIPSCLISLFLIGSAQDVIKNSDKPKNPEAGRIVTVKEVMRIPEA